MSFHKCGVLTESATCYVLISHFLDEYRVIVLVDHVIIKGLSNQLIWIDNQQVAPDEGEYILFFESPAQLKQYLWVVNDVQISQIAEYLGGLIALVDIHHRDLNLGLHFQLTDNSGC